MEKVKFEKFPRSANNFSEIGESETEGNASLPQWGWTALDAPAFFRREFMSCCIMSPHKCLAVVFVLVLGGQVLDLVLGVQVLVLVLVHGGQVLVNIPVLNIWRSF